MIQNMETVPAINLTLPITSNETAKFSAYSSAVHKVVVIINTVILGLLQLMSQQSSVFETHKAAFLCFCVFVFFYSVLRVREAIDVRLRPGLVPRLVGHASHLFGGLAALVLVSIVCAAFSIVLFLLWFLWLSTVVYSNFSEIMIYLKASNSSTGLPQLSPV